MQGLPLHLDKANEEIFFYVNSYVHYNPIWFHIQMMNKKKKSYP